MLKGKTSLSVVSIFIVALCVAAYSVYHIKHRVTHTLKVNPSTKTEKRKLIFDQEFNGQQLDKALWNTVDKAWPFSQQLEYYTPKAVSVQDGNLVIKSGQRSPWKIPLLLSQRQFTSGRVTTEDKFAFTYGTVEIRAKLPAGPGLFSALWLRSKSNKPYGEIDIAEMIGRRPDMVNMAIHAAVTKGKEYVAPNFSQAYHVYKMVWTPTSITWYIDGMKRMEVTKGIPHQPMYIVLNTAIGGPWAGIPTPKTKFPAYLYVDYVRVYQ